MIDLIESHDAQDARACWKWMYLAELFGTDLSRDDYRAIHEDETDYDDDVGGPAFVKGRSGIALPALPTADDDSARAMALTLYGVHRNSQALRMASRT